MAMRINWKEVKHRMIERDVRSLSKLAEGADIHPNTIYKDGPFLSTTVDRLADFLGCKPQELIMLTEVKDDSNS